ncbi:hypothetical protein [Streptomyces sp. IMTB 2501]|nr:hypothetical protein [Streptomyces sp. IMTB 2501]
MGTAPGLIQDLADRPSALDRGAVATLFAMVSDWTTVLSKLGLARRAVA